MPGGGKKAVFPPLNLHDHDQVRISTNDQDRQKKLLQSREFLCCVILLLVSSALSQHTTDPVTEAFPVTLLLAALVYFIIFYFHSCFSRRSLELKEALDKEKNDGPKNKKSMASSSKSVEKSPNGKADQQKTPTKSEQKALLKLEQQQIKSEQKAQQKLEKEQQKLEKEHQKEQLKLEKEHQKEQQKLEKEQQKLEKEQKSKVGFRSKQAEYFSSLRENPQLKTQKSIDLSCLKHQKSMESPRHPARKSVDMQYRQDLVDPSSFSTALSSMNLKPKK